MPLPLIPVAAWIYGVLAAGATAGVGTLTYSEVKRWFGNVGPEAVQEALDRMGIKIDANHPINDETLTAVINSQFLEGSGVQLDSIFDKEKLKNGLAKIAVARAAEKFGFVGVTTEAGFKNSLKEYVQKEALAQLEGETGEIYSAAPKSVKIEKIIIDCRKSEYQRWNDPSDFSDYGIKNRERQKRYRDSHKRTWVLRGGVAPAGVTS